MIGPRGSDDTEKVMDVGWGDGALPVITVDFFVRFSLKMKETLWSLVPIFAKIQRLHCIKILIILFFYRNY